MIDASDVTVIVPAYDVAEYLAACLDSIIENGGRDARIIVIDDGSRDATRDVAVAHQGRHPNITVVTTENAGQSAARNAGLRLAETGFVTFVDADDLIAENGLSLLLAAAAPDIDIVFSNRHRFGNSNRGQQYYYGDISRAAPTALPLPGMVSIHGKLFRRAFLIENALWFPEGMVYEDVSFSMETLLHADLVSSIAAVTYLWRTRKGGKNPSTTQMRLAPKVLDGRMRQIEMTLAIERSAAWQARFGATTLYKLEFRRRMMMHVGQMERSTNEAAVRRAFDQIRPFILSHRALIEATVPTAYRAGYEAIFAGDVEAILALSRPAPTPAPAPTAAPAPAAVVPLPNPVARRRSPPRRWPAMSGLRWKVGAGAVGSLAVLSELSGAFRVSELVVMAFG